MNQARERFGDPDMAFEQLYIGVDEITRDHDLGNIELSKQEATKTGHFENRHTIRVLTTTKILKEFRKLCFIKIPGSKWLVKAKIKLDKEKILEAWKKAGYPLKWKAETFTEDDLSF
ncbi:MAG: hypothetical protein OXU23_15925 [Candidatus Poribacteria bacterium]|nr:hypothetical protein [Candidatus Poribacteria bacterium]